MVRGLSWWRIRVRRDVGDEEEQTAIRIEVVGEGVKLGTSLSLELGKVGIDQPDESGEVPPALRGSPEPRSSAYTHSLPPGGAGDYRAFRRARLSRLRSVAVDPRLFAPRLMWTALVPLPVLVPSSCVGR